MAKTKLESFVDQFVAFVQGDTDKATAEKVYRQRISALNTELNNAKGDIIDLEQSVTDCEEALIKARLNDGNIINGKEDRNLYVNSLIVANNAVETAKEELESKKDLIAFLEAELKL